MCQVVKDGPALRFAAIWPGKPGDAAERAIGFWLAHGGLHIIQLYPAYDRFPPRVCENFPFMAAIRRSLVFRGAVDVQGQFEPPCAEGEQGCRVEPETLVGLV